MVAADLVRADPTLAHEAGFRLPLYLTRRAWDDCVAWTEADTDRTGWPQDETGRLWDVLFMAVRAARSALPNGQPRGVGDLPVGFGVYRVPRDLDREEAVRLQDAGEEVAEPVALVLRRGEGSTLVIDLAEAVA